MEPFVPRPAAGRPPYLIAHRGVSGKTPENTLAAFAHACESPGIDMIELDVRLSGDEQVIVLHDRTLQRTSTGNGAARRYSVAEIKEFDAGSWFDPAFSKERIPTLDETLALVDKRRWVNIELKSDFFFRERPELLERKVLEAVQRQGYEDLVLYSSFDHHMVANIKRLQPRASVGVLYNIYRDYGRMPSKLARRAGASVFVCARHELNRRMLEDAAAEHLAVFVYTLNSTVAVAKMLEMNVHGILSDVADDIVPLLGA